MSVSVVQDAMAPPLTAAEVKARTSPVAVYLARFASGSRRGQLDALNTSTAVLSANLTLPDYGRVARHPSSLAVGGVFTPVLAKHSKPVRKQVEGWQRSELADVTAYYGQRCLSLPRQLFWARKHFGE